jgi:hypothetical protein
LLTFNFCWLPAKRRAKKPGVFAPHVIQGRWLGVEELEALQRLIAEHPHWSRRRLSIALCEALNWRTASGQLKDMSARLLSNKLAERGFVKLPPRSAKARYPSNLISSDPIAGRHRADELRLHRLDKVRQSGRGGGA